MALTDDTSPKQPQKNRVRRHRRTASAGSDSLKNFLSSGSSASDTHRPNQSSTLPLSVTRQHNKASTAAIRPGSADSTRFEAHSPPPGADTAGEFPPTQSNEPRRDMISQYAKDVQESIEEMISLTEQEMTTPIALPTSVSAPSTAAPTITTPAKTKAGLGGVPPSSSTKPSSTHWFLPRFPGKLYGSKSAGKDKAGKMADSNGDSNKHEDILDGTGQLSRIPSLVSSVGRSDSFASTASTTFSGLGGESSPYSTLSLDSLLIDSLDNMLQHNSYSLDKHHHIRSTGTVFTPIIQPTTYLHTSSSDEESRYSYSSGNRTLKRSTLSDKSSQGGGTATGAGGRYSNFFQPVSGGTIHHHTNSSCDSDQLVLASTSYPLHRNESISISDMDKELTDHEGVQERIESLQKQLGKVRRSSTGSVTICNNSGSSLEDIKTAAYVSIDR